MEDKNKMEEAASSAFDDIRQLDRSLNSAHDTCGRIWYLGQRNKRLWSMVEFMTTALDTKIGLPFKVEFEPLSKKVSEASKLARYFGRVHGFLELYSRDLAFAPDLQLFFDCYRNHSIRYCQLQRKGEVGADGTTDAETFNNFITVLRTEGDRIGVRRKLADWRRNADENHTRLRKYINALFEVRARLVVVRIDFFYKKGCLSEAEILKANEKLQKLAGRDVQQYLNGEDVTERETLARIDVAEAIADRAHLFRNMRSKPSLFEHLVGFVWSMEWSRAGGYHFHCAFLFDGARVQKHEHLGDEIGKYWESVVTEGRGLYHNCNREKASYGDAWGIGVVDYYDVAKRERLMRALAYLAKRDQFVYVKPSIKCKLFGTGWSPSGPSGMGRPRKK
jgi:hypothetical protein